MQVTREQLDEAVSAGLISTGQADALWRYLLAQQSDTPGFRPAHILYYVGGMLAISAVSFFITLAWSAFAGWPMLVLCGFLAWLGIALTHFFLHVKQLPIPAGIMITFTVALTPLAVYSLQYALGLWQGDLRSVDFHRYVDWRWILMELATLATAALAFWRYRMPFLLFPVAVAFIGIGIIFAGVQWQRHEARLNAGILGTLPGPVRELVLRAHQ